MTNYWIFPVLLAAIVGSLLIEWQLWLVFLGIIIVLQICCKNHKKLWLFAIACSFFVCLRTSQQLQQTILSEKELAQSSFQLELLPDTIKVNGDLVTFISKDTQTNKKYQTRLKVNSQEEKEVWLNQTASFILSCEGELSQASEQRNLNGFNYRQYLQTIGVSGIFEVEKYQTASNPNENNFPSIRRKVIQHIEKNFSEKTAAYMLSLIVGYRNAEFSELREIYSGVGLVQLISMSGMHITMILRGIHLLLRRFNLTAMQSFLPLVCISLCLCILFGGRAPILRGTIVFLLAQIKKICNWRLSSLDTFAITLFIVLLIEPFLFYGVSGIFCFTISFLLLRINEMKFTKYAALKRGLLLQVGIMPVLATAFFQIPLLSGLLGLIFFPFFKFILFPALIFALFLSLFKNFSLFPLFLIFLNKTIEITESLLKVFEGFRLPASFVSSQLLLVLIIFVSLWLSSIKNKEKVKSFCFCLFICLPLYKHYLNPQGMLAFVDVGQGDSIYFEAPFQSETILIDTGGRLEFSQESWQQRTSQPASDYNLVPFIESRGINQLDKLILTHADEDHLGEVLNLLETISVKQLVIADGMQENPKLLPIIKKILIDGGKVRLMQAGEKIGNYFQLNVLYPDKKVIGENNDSLVVWTEIQQKTFLFTGDLEMEGERALLKAYPNLQADVLKVGHHGSRTSTSEEFIEQVKPDLAVITCGVDNRFGHPHAEVLENLQNAQILRSDQDGMIYFTWSDFEELSLKTVVKKNNFSD